MILVGFYNFWVLGRSTREGGGLASLAPGWGAGASGGKRAGQHASARVMQSLAR